MLNFWNIIIESNTFNFLVLVAIFWVIAVKINLSEKFSAFKESVVSALNSAKNSAKLSQNNLSEAKKDLNEANIEAENLLINAKDNAQSLYNDIIEKAKIKINHIENVAEKSVRTDEKRAERALVEYALVNAVNSAESKLTSKIENDKNLGRLIVENCIKELDNIKL